MSDKKHLTQRGDTWYFNYRIPKHLKEYIGKDSIQKSLGTDSLKVARRLRDQLLSDLNFKEDAFALNPEGAILRELVKKIRTEFESIVTQEQYEGFHGFYDAESEAISGNKIKAAAILMAQDDTNPTVFENYDTRYKIKEMTASYVKHIENKVSISTIRNTKRAVRKLIEHNNGKDLVLETITRAQIVRYIDYLSQDINSKTINTLLSCLNQIWNFAYDRNFVERPSPFKDHRIKKTRENPDSKKPFNLDQWSALTSELNANASTFARKWIAPIGLMTGMRINEIAGLHKEDVYQESNGRWFFNLHEDERRLKTKASIRKVPIHKSIEEAVLILKSESDNEFLLPEVINNTSRRAQTIGGWFSRVKTQYVSKERSYCFHSLRGMLSTAFENASIEEGIAASIVGHKRPSLTYGLYSNGVKPEMLCNAIDKAGVELELYIKHFPKIDSKKG